MGITDDDDSYNYMINLAIDFLNSLAEGTAATWEDFAKYYNDAADDATQALDNALAEETAFNQFMPSLFYQGINW